MLKKEYIYVKLTKNNIDKAISILEERCLKHDLLIAETYLKYGFFEDLYVYCGNGINGDYWTFSLQETNKNKARVKLKQLREILLK